MSHNAGPNAAYTKLGSVNIKDSWLLRLDPRARVVGAFLFACVVVSLSNFIALGVAVAFGLFTLLSAKLSPKETLQKVLTMDGFIIFLICMLPFTTPGEALFTLFGFDATKEGFLKAFEIMLKANAVVMTLLAMISTIDPIVLGHALNRMRVPENLVHLMLFSVRYIDVLKQEYYRLRTAMKARCFKPGNNLHTYRSIGYLLGMLLVRSIERSERILEAMKCRGFQGKFYLLSEFHFQQRDRIFCAVIFMFLVLLVFLDIHYG